MGKMRLSFRAVLLIMTIPLITCLVIAILFSNSEILGTYDDAESLFYDNLYKINSELINADRDFYQAMVASKGLAEESDAAAKARSS